MQVRLVQVQHFFHERSWRYATTTLDGGRDPGRLRGPLFGTDIGLVARQANQQHPGHCPADPEADQQ
jgi:hypothetical protein